MARFQDGTVFDKTESEEPLTFTQGEGKALPVVEQAVLGMALGETKTVRIAQEDLYRSHNPDLVMQLDRAEFAKRGIQPEIGLALETNQDKEQTRAVRITAITDTTVTLDANHPLDRTFLNFRTLFGGRPSRLIDLILYCSKGGT